MKRILECSSAGDARFSAFYAQVEINGVMQSIEEHYQLSKRFRDPSGRYVIPDNMAQAKGKYPLHFVAFGLPYPPKYLEAWYIYLWIQYLDSNPMLVKILNHYDDYNDKFSTSSTINSQATAIRRYMHEGKDSLMEQYKDFYDCFKPYASTKA